MLDPGTILQERYRLVRLIGQGGMGAVYEAVDQRLGTTVALKQTHAPGGALGRAFEREARLLAGLRHPSLPKVIDHFADATGQYLVMEYIPGDDLATLLERRGAPFPVQEALAWADQLLRVLEYLHTRQPPILHRDIKPQNLKLTAEGEVVLLDFGLARGDPAAHSQVTSGGSLFGYTPHYAPLEQVHNSGTDQRSDLYALAATLHHLLTGVKPADALSRATAVLRRQPDPLGSPGEINPLVPPEVSAVLLRALSLNQEERPASAAEMRAALAHARAAAAASPPDWDAPTVAAVAEVPEDEPPRPSAPRPQALARTGALAAWLRRLAMIPLPAPLARLAGQRPLWQPLAAAGALLLLLLLAVRGGGETPRAERATLAPRATAVRPAATRTLGSAGVAVPTRPAPVPSAAPAGQSGVTPTAVQPARAASLEPDAVYAGRLPVVLTVRGEGLDRVRAFQLRAASGAAIVPEVRNASTSEALLVIGELPGLLNGEEAFALYLDDVAQPLTVVLRDYRERRTIRGVRAAYSYTGRVSSDESGALTQMLTDPASGSAPVAVLRNGDEVDLLRDDVPGWYQVRLVIRGRITQASVVGWVERWLVDNQGVPEAPVFAGRLGKTPTDAAVPCGARQYKSSIYGSVERADGGGIGGALVRVTSADGRNRFSQRTKKNGTFAIGGLGCTTWVVELLEVPGLAGFKANAVTVKNLNGGQYTAAEVRFRRQP
ncbi:MAG TPA: protein kinase [Roseiflexaceae bacterium]|nr:protein kinase [Roseiflexaceae bacterium]